MRLGRGTDEVVQREQELLHLRLLLVDLLRNLLQVAQPLGRVLVAGLVGLLHLPGEALDGLGNVLELLLQLLELLIDRLRIHRAIIAGRADSGPPWCAESSKQRRELRRRGSARSGRRGSTRTAADRAAAARR